MVIGTPCINLAIIPHKLEAPIKNIKKSIQDTFKINNWKIEIT